MGGHRRAGAETGGDEGLPPGCPTSVSEKRRESRSTGDGHGPGVGPLGTAGDADAVAAHAFPWGQARTPRGPVLTRVSSTCWLSHREQ